MWIKNHIHEKFYQKAKEEGFRARSAFKLLHILRKYPILDVNGQFAHKVLDLGCSPGSWIEVVMRKYQDFQESNQVNIPPPKILGIDLTSIRPFPEFPTVSFERIDIFTPECEAKIKEWSKGKLDVILSDLAPKTGGNDTDVRIQEAMVLRVFELANFFLRPGGHVAIKVFQSEETQRIIAEWKTKFELLKPFKPQASQPQSRELFLVGMNFLNT